MVCTFISLVSYGKAVFLGSTGIGSHQQGIRLQFFLDFSTHFKMQEKDSPHSLGRPQTCVSSASASQVLGLGADASPIRYIFAFQGRDLTAEDSSVSAFGSFLSVSLLEWSSWQNLMFNIPVPVTTYVQHVYALLGHKSRSGFWSFIELVSGCPKRHALAFFNSTTCLWKGSW